MTTDSVTGDSLVLAVSGEVDLFSAPVFEEAVTAALGRGPRLLVIDLTGVGFLASVGMTILLKANRDGGRDLRVRVVAAERSAVARALELTGLTDILGVVPTRADALAR
ncbi:STAS domain-containing protein [Amycolatopsis sp. NPDC049691]|uniref:STAS domain-containing protein n=1 Tax=Amycolatopsis sp. NPDC049691 TaxID=3155155 RepID=UPI00341BCD96